MFFVVVSILEGCVFFNGFLQNILVFGVFEFVWQYWVFVGGDDFKLGQIKVKFVFVDFFIGFGFKIMFIVSYNYLGNNDGENLLVLLQFCFKEVFKSNVVDDMVQSNLVFYMFGEEFDYCVVIKYVLYVGDSKCVLDEYILELMLGGINILVLYNMCEDLLLVVFIMLDLVLLIELCQCVSFCIDMDFELQIFYFVLFLFSFFFKVLLVLFGSLVVNVFFCQCSCIENIFRVCVGFLLQNYMFLEYKMECLGFSFK